MKIAMIYGEMSSSIRPEGFDVEGLYTRVGLTGSESSFFNLARSLAERGHNVAAFVACREPFTHASGLEILPISALGGLAHIALDAAIAWNEPDYLRAAPPGVLRLLDQQLNDFGYCQPGWQDIVDVFVAPSLNHARYLVEREGAPGAKAKVIANSVDLELLPKEPPPRNPHRVVYCSSPDRGLHHLLAMWPEIRARVPDAELKIFYRLDPWLASAREFPSDHPEPTIAAVGRRARYIEEALRRLEPGAGSRFGVEVVGPVPNERMLRELSSAAVLAYPCDPVRYTEGFGVSVLDAAAAGCLPIISCADALPTVHAEVGGALGIDGKPGEKREKWIHWVTKMLLEGVDAVFPDAREKMAAHARKHSRQVIAAQWETLLVERLGARAFAA